MSEKQVKKGSYAGRDREDRECIHRARDARFAATGEPELAPNHDDAKAEQAKTASKGSKSK